MFITWLAKLKTCRTKVNTLLHFVFRWIPEKLTFCIVLQTLIFFRQFPLFLCHLTSFFGEVTIRDFSSIFLVKTQCLFTFECFTSFLWTRNQVWRQNIYIFLYFVGIDDTPDKVEDDHTETVSASSASSSDLIVYSADALLKLRTVTMSQKWPDYLDEAFKNNRGSWDPDRWHQNKRRGSTPPAEEKKNNNEAGGDKEAANKVN